MLTRRCCLMLILAASSVSAVVATPIVTPVESTFDLDLDGWFDDQLGVDAIHISTGGNPGGYLQWTQTTTAELVNARAPAKFLGDWSALDGTGVLSWDLRIVSAGNLPVTLFYTPSVRIFPPFAAGAAFVGPSQALSLVGVNPWIHIEAPLIESQWEVVGAPWLDILSDVSSVAIRLELIANNALPGETTGIDNVRLEGGPIVPQPVSEHATLALLASACGVLGVFTLYYRKRPYSGLPPLSEARTRDSNSQVKTI